MRLALVLVLALGACGGEPNDGGGRSGSGGRMSSGGAGSAGGGGLSSGGGAVGGADGGGPTTQPDGGPLVDAGPVSIEMGQGPLPWRPIVDGDAMPVMPGNQGLPMLVFSIRALGPFEAGDVARPTFRDPLLITACVNVATGREVGSGRMQQPLHPQEDGSYAFSDGWTPFLVGESEWMHQRVRCTAKLTDGNGRSAMDVREVYPNGRR